MVFSFLEMQIRLTETNLYYKYLCSVWKEMTSKPLKIAASKIIFFSVYLTGKTCFDECFLFHMITGGHFFIKVCRYSERFFNAMLLCSLKQVFWKQSIFYAQYPTNNIIKLRPKDKNKAIACWLTLAIAI